MDEIRVSHDNAQDVLDGLGEIPEGVEFPKDFIGADGNFEAPSAEELLKALDKMSGLSPEDRDMLRSQLQQQMGQDSYSDDIAQTWGEIPAGSFLANQTFVLFSLLVLALIVVFFGLKLYSSLTEKERKREEKRRMKLLKKKK